MAQKKREKVAGSSRVGGPGLNAQRNVQDHPSSSGHGPGKCNKVTHNKERGYLHGPDDDTPYNDDGLLYCGRCHRWID